MLLHGDGIWQHKMSHPSRVGFQFENTDEDQVLRPSPLHPPQADEGIKYHKPKHRLYHSKGYFSLMKTELLFNNL